MSSNTSKIPRISSANRDDPLTDLNALKRIGLAATKHARARAFDHRDFVTVAIKGDIFKIFADGTKALVKAAENKSKFPRIEDDLCHD